MKFIGKLMKQGTNILSKVIILKGQHTISPIYEP